MHVLNVDHVSKSFGGIKALVDLNIYLNEKEIVSVIGPNGSGKTTLFNCICGTLEADRGKIELLGEDITYLPPHAICQKGMLRTFQQVAVFEEMTLLENMLVAQPHQGENVFLTPLQRSTKQRRERAIELLKFVNLVEKKNDPARALSYGQKKLLEFIMSFMSNPKVFLLDEPMAGVNPTLVNQILGYIRNVVESFGVSILVVEHNMQAVMNISDRIYVLAQGRKIAEGKPEEVQRNALVIEAYFGGGSECF